jgi:hypothetical protein
MANAPRQDGKCWAFLYRVNWRIGSDGSQRTMAIPSDEAGDAAVPGRTVAGA